MATTKTYAPKVSASTRPFREVRVGTYAYEVCEDGVKMKDGNNVQGWATLPKGARWRVVTVLTTRASGAPTKLGAGEYPNEPVVVDAAEGSRRLYHTASEEIGADVALAILFLGEPDAVLNAGRINRLLWLAECKKLRPPLAKGDLGELLKREATSATGANARAVAQRIAVYLCDVARTSETWRLFPNVPGSNLFTTAALTTIEAEKLVRRNCDVLALRARYCADDGTMESIQKLESTRKEREGRGLFTGEGAIWSTDALVGMCAHLQKQIGNAGVPDLGEWRDVLERLRDKHDKGALRQEQPVTELQKAVERAALSQEIDIMDDIDFILSATSASQSFGRTWRAEFLAATTAYAQRSVDFDSAADHDTLLATCAAEGYEEERRMLTEKDVVLRPGKSALLTARVGSKRRVLAQRHAAQGAIARIAGGTEIDETFRADARLLIEAMNLAEELFVASLGTDASYDALAAAWAARGEPASKAKGALTREALRLALAKRRVRFGAPESDERLVAAAGIVVDALRGGECDPAKHAAVARASAKFARVMRCGLYDSLVAACAKRNSRSRAMKFV
jgi:hypothetical protein